MAVQRAQDLAAERQAALERAASASALVSASASASASALMLMLVVAVAVMAAAHEPCRIIMYR